MTTQSNEIDQLATALVAAQQEIKPVVKDAANPYFKSSYADLSSVIEASVPVLNKHDIAVIQSSSYEPNFQGIIIDTVLTHKSGQWIKGRYPCPATKFDAQGVGASTSYARRYALAAMLSLSQHDDDGETAVGRGEYKDKYHQNAGPQVATPAEQDNFKAVKKDLAVEVSELMKLTGVDGEFLKAKFGHKAKTNRTQDELKEAANYLHDLMGRKETGDLTSEEFEYFQGATA